MFGIGIPELIVIAAVALIFIGPDKIPGVLKSIGKGLVELKRATSDVRSTVQNEMDKIEEEIELNEVRKTAEDLSNDLGKIANKVTPLSLSKMSSDEQVEKKEDLIGKPKKEDLDNEKEVGSNKSKTEKTTALHKTLIFKKASTAFSSFANSFFA